MICTANEVFDFVNQEDVKFIRLAFCDVSGKQKNISILPNELERAFCFHSSAKPETECMKKPFFQGFRPKERQVVFVFCRKAVD